MLESRLIEDRYPNYEAVIPTDNTKVMKVKREQLIASTRRVALYANPSTHMIRLDIGSAAVQLRAQDQEFGWEATEKIACDYADGDIAIGFNSLYDSSIFSPISKGTRSSSSAVSPRRPVWWHG